MWWRLALQLTGALTVLGSAATFKLGIVGLVHDHINEATYGLPASTTRNDINLVGIAEANQTIVQFYIQKYNLPPTLFYDSVEALLKDAKPVAVQVFTDIVSHAHVVQVCASFGVHVMVEKPLAVNHSQALAIQFAAQTTGIQVLTNYITTWYPSTHYMYNAITNTSVPNVFGPLRKTTFRTGHFGTKEIGCNPWFVEMDMDPARSGGGALMCFASYGLSIMTALMNVTSPACVSATTRHFKTDPVYARVEDDATILLQYGDCNSSTNWLASATIEPSWNWPWNRKDMDFDGVSGALSSLTDSSETKVNVRHGWARKAPPPVSHTADPVPKPYDNPLTYLIAASSASSRASLDPNALSVVLSGLPLNLIVMKAIDMAYESAHAAGKAVCE